MVRALFAGVAALLLAACGEPPSTSSPADSPFLWEVTNEQGEVEGWLYGTIHALPDGTDWRGKAIDDVIDAADYLVVEVANLNDGAAIAAEFQRAARSAGHPMLRERVAPGDASVVEELAARTPYSGEEFRQIETWAAALMLAQTISREAESANGVDKALLLDFRDRQIVELEGAAAQFAIFDELAEEDQRVLLNAVIEEATGRDTSPDPSDLWLSGDIDALNAETQRGILADPEVRDALLVQRNYDWVGQCVALFADEKLPLIAVGAAHLAGSQGMVAMLEMRGYTVRRLR